MFRCLYRLKDGLHVYIKIQKILYVPTDFLAHQICLVCVSLLLFSICKAGGASRPLPLRRSKQQIDVQLWFCISLHDIYIIDTKKEEETCASSLGGGARTKSPQFRGKVDNAVLCWKKNLVSAVWSLLVWRVRTLQKTVSTVHIAVLSRC